MVLIHLKSQFVSLIITVLSGAAELCLFGAALGFNRYAECNALRRGRPVSVRFHRIRTKFLAVLAMLVFIVLEVIVSFFSDPADSLQPERRPCIAVGRYDIRTDDDPVFNIDSDSVMINCVRADGNEVFQRLGNRSLTDGEVRCAKSASYKYIGEGRVDQPIPPNFTRTCRPFGCVVLGIRQRQLIFSAVLAEREIDRLEQMRFPLPFLITELFFDLDRDQEAVLGERALEAFSNSVNDPLELRRRILTGTENTTCPFFLRNEATEVPLVLIYLVAASWIISVLLFVSTLLFKRQIFYDMGDPLHWAQRTYRNIDEPISGNPVVTSVYEHGERLMYVSSSSSDEYDFLKKVRSTLGDKLRGRRRQPSEASVEEQQV